MHELGITRNVVAICAEHAGGARVIRVRLEIGKQAGVLAESVRFCFDICAKGTTVEGATLEILEPGGAELKEWFTALALSRDC
ncbi:MAG: hydrogenase maturation nickel metallochaperone HypA [Ramlibacter sp.]